MLFDESDIDFEKINFTEFEELCFDLLLNLGFHSLTWRQGGSDSGRDIEAIFSVTNPLIGNYDEQWFIECKHHSSGVPVDKITSKIAWADAEKPKHLAFIVSSYMANSTRDWINKVQRDKSYSIHLIEGKQLKSLILGFPSLIDKYFIDKYRKLLTEIKRNWIVFDVLPNPDTLYLLHKQIPLEKMSIAYIAFFWCLWHINREELESRDDNNNIELPMEYEIKLKSHSTFRGSVLQEYDQVKALELKRLYITLPDGREYNHLLTSPMVLRKGQESFPALYCLKAITNNTGLEVVIEGKTELSAKIRHIKTKVQTRFKDVEKSCIALWKVECTYDMRNKSNTLTVI